MTYKVTTSHTGGKFDTCQTKKFNDLGKALKHSEKMVRKKGKISRMPWGTRGGDFPSKYRIAVVTIAN